MAKRDDNEIAVKELQVPKDDDELIAWARKRRQESQARMPDAQMRTNLAFVLGEQWLFWDANNNQFRRASTNTGDGKVRLTINKVAPLVERTIAKLTKNNPAPECRPVSDSDDDIDGAKVGTRILSSEMNRVKWSDELLVELLQWVVTLGWSFAMPKWDPDAGDYIGEADGERIYEGDIAIDIVPAYEMAWDPGASDPEDALWAIRTWSMTKEQVYDKYGVVPTAPDTGRSIVEDVYLLQHGANATPYSRGGNYAGGASTGPFQAYIQVHQMWMKPCRAAPKGMVFTWTGSDILDPRKDFPYDHGKLPFVQFELLPGFGTVEGRTWVNDVIPMQVDYNHARSRETQMRNTLVPKLFLPIGSGVDPQKVSNNVEMITYNPAGGEPHYHQIDSGWMNQWETAMARVDQEMGDRAGVADVSQGKGTSGMPAAAIIALQEADDTKLAISAKRLAAAVGELGYQVLMLARQFWDEPRVVRTWSEAGAIEVYRYQGSDIKRQLDVHVESETMLPRSKAARTQMAMELKAMNPAMDERLFLRLLDMPGTEFLLDGLNEDTRQAHRENGIMVREQLAPPVNDFDNHEVHISEHNRVRKSEDYEKMTPEQKAIIDAHVNVHEELMLVKQGFPLPGFSGEVNMPSMESTAVQGAAQAGPGDPATAAPIATTAAGIGGPAEPGRVPGVSLDAQQASMGN